VYFEVHEKMLVKFKWRYNPPGFNKISVHNMFGRL